MTSAVDTFKKYSSNESTLVARERHHFDSYVTVLLADLHFYYKRDSHVREVAALARRTICMGNHHESTLITGRLRNKF
jgi:hypothetical protein